MPSTHETKKSRWLSFFWRVLRISLGGTVVVVAISVGSNRQAFSRDIGSFGRNLAYTASIAMPSILLLDLVSKYLGGKFPRMLILFQSLALLAAAVIGCLATGLVLRLFGVVPPGEYWNEFSSSVQLSIVIALIFGLFLILHENLRYRVQATEFKLRAHEVDRERSTKLLTDAKLSSLESRIHPHFLFNTLNSISSLIPKSPLQAEQTLVRLASLLRFSLNVSQNSLVPLNQEIKIVRDYLEIEKVRFGARLNYEVRIPCEYDQVGIPPLALQSLVENSVKYAVTQRRDGGNILLEAYSEETRIVLEVTDDGPGFSEDVIQIGHGLENLTARLSLLFGPEGSLGVDRRDGHTIVKVTLPRTQPTVGGSFDSKPI